MKRHHAKFLAESGIVLGSTAAIASGGYEIDRQIRVEQYEHDKHDFYSDHGLLEKNGKVDQVKLLKWEREHGLRLVEEVGGVEKFNNKKFEEMVKEWKLNKAKINASELPDIALDK